MRNSLRLLMVVGMSLGAVIPARTVAQDTASDRSDRTGRCQDRPAISSSDASQALRDVVDDLNVVAMVHAGRNEAVERLGRRFKSLQPDFQ